MEYKYEMHCHTGRVSLCAKTEPKELVKMYADLGYSGLVLTDHYSPMTFWGKRLFSAEKMAEHYLSAYRELKDYGGEGFTVLLGMELRHYATVNDYLIYGVEEDWLLRQPNMLTWGMKKRYEETRKAGYLLFQAHPYRPFIHRCNPAYIDGIVPNSAIAIEYSGMSWRGNVTNMGITLSPSTPCKTQLRRFVSNNLEITTDGGVLW